LNLISISGLSLDEFITPSLITELVNLLNSQVKKERDLVSEILLTIYEKLVNKRKIIRNTILHWFENIIYDDNEFSGTAELLNFYSLVIRGFVVPLKQTNIDFFNKILIPLHKLGNIQNFFQSLMNCCMIFIMKDAHLANQLIDSLVKYMPFGNSAKEELFILEIREILTHVESSVISQTTFIKHCKRIARSVKDSTFLTGIKNISLITTPQFLELLCKYRTDVLHLFYPALDKLFQWDVNDEYNDLLTLIEFKLSKIDQDAYETYLKKKEDVNDGNSKTSDEKWKHLEQLAQEKHKDFTSPMIPYCEHTSLSNFNETYHWNAYKSAR